MLDSPRPSIEATRRPWRPFVLKTKGQSPQEIVGKYVVVWQKEGNDWKLATDIWNANK
jgi:ketosteroid isomerase-like protein